MCVLIKGLDMPGVFCGADIVLYEGINGSAVPRKYKISADQIVPVPPHGRLIDADALPTYDKPIGKMMMFGGEYVYTQTAIDNAPTIIPASEEGE